MESHPQNPEFRNNPENVHPCTISVMSNGLDPDQDQCSVCPDLDPNCLQRFSAKDKSTA